MRVIERRTDKIVHGGVDDDKIPGLTMLHEQHTRHQNAGISNEQATGFKDQPAIKVAGGSLDHLGISSGMGRRLIVIAVGNAQPSTEIDMGDRMAIRSQCTHEFGKQRERIAERIKFRDLAADVHVDASDLEALELSGVSIDLARAADRNAKLVLGLAGS